MLLPYREIDDNFESDRANHRGNQPIHAAAFHCVPHVKSFCSRAVAQNPPPMESLRSPGCLSISFKSCRVDPDIASASAQNRRILHIRPPWRRFVPRGQFLIGMSRVFSRPLADHKAQIASQGCGTATQHCLISVNPIMIQQNRIIILQSRRLKRRLCNEVVMPDP